MQGFLLAGFRTSADSYKDWFIPHDDDAMRSVVLLRHK